MIDKDLSLDRTRTSCLKPEVKKGIETGDLLSAEDILEIETGDLLSAQSVNDIVTGDLLTPNPLPVTSGFPLNYARIGYDNILFNGSADDDNGNLTASNLLTPSTYDKWRPTIDPSTARVYATTEGLCDYVGLAAHNFGSEGATITVSVWYLGVGTTVFFGAPSDDSAIYIRFDQQLCDQVNIKIDNSTSAELGVVYSGIELEMMRPIYSGHTPAPLGATNKYTPQMSDGGQFLGKILVRQGFKTQAAFKHLTNDWYRSEFQPFVEHAQSKPYFWAWNLLEAPDDVVYGWTNDNITPSLMGIRDWFEVTFDIEAHG